MQYILVKKKPVPDRIIPRYIILPFVSIAKRKEYLDRQLKNILDKSAKTEAEHQREQLLVDQCVFLTEEQEYVMVSSTYHSVTFQSS